MTLKYDIVEYTRGRGLEVNLNPDTGKLYAHFIGVDDDQLSLFAGGVFDFVFSQNLAKRQSVQAWRVVKQGGYLVVSAAHDEITASEPPGGFDVVRHQSYNHGAQRLVVFKKRSDKQVNVRPEPWPEKSCCIVRYGGIGDMIQTSSILPGLKAQGYHITLNTDPSGHRIIKHDPNIDHFILQDKNQVPNEELGPYWKALSRRYSKFINLCESVEATFLALPGRMPHLWPHDVRHARLNVNYMEHIHALAGVDLPPQDRFYPTPKEAAWASKQYRRITRFSDKLTKWDKKRGGNGTPTGGTVILWTLSGSSTHKTWPHLDQLLARLLVTYPDVFVVLVGDGLCKLLEIGWENEPRIIERSGVWSVRETLAFAEIADLVIGPETGVIASVAMRPVPKIIFMSHASVENLTKYWTNTISLEPEDCDCYPCHQLHYGKEYCPRDEETGVAVCQAKISVDATEAAIQTAMLYNDTKPKKERAV